ncbi:polysaccharide pyruvyl transferase family protein [Blastococcus atacamensis]|uniref:polysaccharide pyruvyl transferase family protein n=1 Tax=Blastococcus atacamensis TaxID=2070508 RepID=UPI0012FFE009|nr:polysaccharide pyruvyl transferase family protein [Blastococcus atacamensis]
MKVLILHAYSAANRGDGLLVDEAIEVVRSAFGADVELAVAAHYPESFAYPDVEVVGTHPRAFLSRTGLPRHVVRYWRRYDLVVGVGGGYLRGPTLSAALKCVVIHVVQLVIAGRYPARRAYLPQSVGPFPPLLGAAVKRLLRRIDRVYLRDDRSMAEFGGPNARRVADMVVSSAEAVARRRDSSPAGPPVLSVRAVFGRVSDPVRRLAGRLEEFDGYVQSDVGANSDVDAMASLAPRHVVTASELLTGPPRVVIAVRLHAALMALNAGHYVVHLAYERKGWGAFGDLGLGDYVHNVWSFDVETVLRQVAELTKSADLRQAYDEAVTAGRVKAGRERLALIQELRTLAMPLVDDW